MDREELELRVWNASLAQPGPHDLVHPRDDALRADRQERGAGHRVGPQRVRQIFVNEASCEWRVRDPADVLDAERALQEVTEQLRMTARRLAPPALLPEILREPGTEQVTLTVRHYTSDESRKTGAVEMIL